MEEKKYTPEQQELIDELTAYLCSPASAETEQTVFGDRSDPITEKFIEEEARSEKKGERDSFKECLLALMERKGITKPSELYRAACISKFTFSRIMNYKSDHRPAKDTVAALAIGLRCTMEEAQALYHSAGYHLGTADLLDRVIGFFIRQKRYSVVEVNICLDAFGAQLIGEQSRDRE